MNISMNESQRPDEKTEFITTDLAHAAALRSYGIKLIRMQEKEDVQRHRTVIKTEFVFQKFSKELNIGVPEVLVKFSNNELEVDAKTLLDNYRNLKATSFGKGMKT